jgi:hypothetical protein
MLLELVAQPMKYVETITKNEKILRNKNKSISLASIKPLSNFKKYQVL